MLLNLLGRLSPRTNFNLTADVMVAFDYSEKQSTRYNMQPRKYLQFFMWGVIHS